MQRVCGSLLCVLYTGWPIQVKIYGKQGDAHTSLLLMLEVVQITFSVPEQFVNLVGSIEYAFCATTPLITFSYVNLYCMFDQI